MTALENQIGKLSQVERMCFNLLIESGIEGEAALGLVLVQSHKGLIK
jgi:hypothetical protein